MVSRSRVLKISLNFSISVKLPTNFFLVVQFLQKFSIITPKTIKNFPKMTLYFSYISRNFFSNFPRSYTTFLQKCFENFFKISHNFSKFLLNLLEIFQKNSSTQSFPHVYITPKFFQNLKTSPKFFFPSRFLQNFNKIFLSLLERFSHLFLSNLF